MSDVAEGPETRVMGRRWEAIPAGATRDSAKSMSVDVVVVGGGAAGTGAAVSAAPA